MFILLGGIFTIGVCHLCCNKIDKDMERFGYLSKVDPVYIIQKFFIVDVTKLGSSDIFDDIDKFRESYFKKGIYFLLNFVPLINMAKMCSYLAVTTFVLKSDDARRERFYDFFNSSVHFSSLKRNIGEKDDFSSFYKSSMLDDNKENIIEWEDDKDTKGNHFKLNEQQRKTVDAMNDAELWLTTIQLDVGLSAVEKRELFMDYVNDFKNENEDAKFKTIKKTIDIIQKNRNM